MYANSLGVVNIQLSKAFQAVCCLVSLLKLNSDEKVCIYSVKKMFLKILQNSQWNIVPEPLFLFFLLKERDFGTGVFLGILQNI